MCATMAVYAHVWPAPSGLSFAVGQGEQEAGLSRSAAKRFTEHTLRGESYQLTPYQKRPSLELDALRNAMRIIALQSVRTSHIEGCATQQPAALVCYPDFAARGLLLIIQSGGPARLAA
jgi:hypothetical protein